MENKKDWRGEKGEYYDLGYKKAIQEVKKMLDETIDKEVKFR